MLHRQYFYQIFTRLYQLEAESLLHKLNFFRQSSYEQIQFH